MRLFVRETKKSHSTLVNSLTWLRTGQDCDVLSFGDDGSIYKSSVEGNATSKVELPISDVGCVLSTARSVPKGAGASEVVLLGCANGKIYIISNKMGRVEKSIEAHIGGVLALKWSRDGSFFYSAGEDGQIKSWSRAGLARTIISTLDAPIVSFCLSVDETSYVCAHGSDLTVKSLVQNDNLSWRAHEDSVLAADLSPSSELIVTIGEDCRYKLWDKFGTLVYSSGKLKDRPQSVKWHSSGDFFVIGAFDQIYLCNSSGEIVNVALLSLGCSIISLEWSPAATHLACSSGKGNVLIATIDEIHMQWNQFEAKVLNSSSSICVNDCINGLEEILDIKSVAVVSSIGYEHVVTVTETHVYVFNVKSWNTPIIIDIDQSSLISSVKQTHGFFALLDHSSGIQVYSYDGRAVCALRSPSILWETMSSCYYSISPDCVIYISPRDKKSIYVHDLSGRPIGEQPTYTHALEITRVQCELALQASSSRFISFIDSSASLYILPMISSTLVNKRRSKKLCSMVKDFIWNQNDNSIAVSTDQTFKIFYYPAACFIDEDLLNYVQVSTETPDGVHLPAGTWQKFKIIEFTSSNCSLQRSDESIGYVSNIQSFPSTVISLMRKKDWKNALKLCRFVNRKENWACLAALSLQMQEYNTAEVAYAALEDIRKVRWVCKVRDETSVEFRQAEMAIFKREINEAEDIYISAGQIKKAIQCLLEIYRWDNALELALKHQKYVQVVMLLRKDYLKEMGIQEEFNKKFIDASGSNEIDEDETRKIIMNDFC